MIRIALKLSLGVTVFALVALSPASRPADAQTPSPFCQYGTTTYNAVLCAQLGGSTSVYCQAGTPNYNATLCAQFGGSTSVYCQAGTLNYNAALCAQLGGSSSSLYCQAGTLNYNAALCSQYNLSQAASITVLSNASGLDCGARATITVDVRALGGAAVPDGTSVSLSADLGTLNPTQATTSLSNVQSIYSAPASGTGTITVTATSGSTSGKTFMALNCAPIVVRPTTVPTLAPALAIALATATAQRLPATSPSIQPPNTGDAGLASTD